MVDTGFIPTEWYHALQSEVAWVYRPLSIQAEGVYSLLEQLNGETVNFTAGYVGISFLTGEHRQYDPKRAAFGPIKVCNEYNPCSNGLAFGGAWELTARLSYINTNDGNIKGGELTDVTAGVNWWLNSNTRLTFNYIQPPGWTNSLPDNRKRISLPYRHRLIGSSKKLLVVGGLLLDVKKPISPEYVGEAKNPRSCKRGSAYHRSEFNYLAAGMGAAAGAAGVSVAGAALPQELQAWAVWQPLSQLLWNRPLRPLKQLFLQAGSHTGTQTRTFLQTV